MVIDNFYIRRSIFSPPETCAPLAVYANAILALAVVLEGFEVIVWRDSQIDEFYRSIKHSQFALHDVQEILRKSP